MSLSNLTSSQSAMLAEIANAYGADPAVSEKTSGVAALIGAWHAAVIGGDNPWLDMTVPAMLAAIRNEIAGGAAKSHLTSGPLELLADIASEVTGETVSRYTTGLGAMLAMITGGGGIVYPQSNFAYRSLAAELQAKGSGYDDKTFQTVIGCERAFVRVKVVLTNIQETAVTVANVAVAASANAWDGDHNPTGTWAQALFGGSAAAVIPARRGAGRPGRIVSDWTTLASIPRDDGGTRPLLYTRAYYGSGQYPSNLGLGGVGFDPDGLWPKPTDDTVNKGRMIEFGGATGNFVASNQNGYSNQAFWPGILAEFIIDYGVPVFSLLGIGNSIMQADTSTYTMEAYGHYACAAASTSDRPIIWANQGYSSQKTANFLARLQDLIADGAAPSAVLYAAYSPNDMTFPPNQADFDGMAANMEAALDIMLAANIIPILVTPTPYSGLEEARDNMRKSYRDVIKGKESNKVLVYDLDAEVSDGATPASYKSGYSDDSLHMNSTGNINAAPGLVPILEQAADMYFGS